VVVRLHAQSRAMKHFGVALFVLGAAEVGIYLLYACVAER